ncbi:hypothetical protein POM88_024404 [Heracleum sosnowskyi]|uniref:Uncharacterized protein n=1 Tax=Heracleum sosnowskyi TaxID=360622 RepID=A0AAD8I2W0_9APIA|nr:hypothetical protein POM88_024404 [Heracleum sosnowskyi]
MNVADDGLGELDGIRIFFIMVWTEWTDIGNLALCGVPLTKKCKNDESPTPEVDDDLDDYDESLEWKLMLMGYGCGLVFGLSMAYIFFTTLKPKWFVAFVKRVEQKLIRRYKKNSFEFLSY